MPNAASIRSLQGDQWISLQRATLTQAEISRTESPANKTRITAVKRGWMFQRRRNAADAKGSVIQHSPMRAPVRNPASAR